MREAILILCTLDETQQSRSSPHGSGEPRSNPLGEVATAGEQLKQLKTKADELDRELASLRNRPALIPEGERQLRELIARGAGISLAELPFAGELMDVREEQSAQWRGALERLLRGFGLSILVSEQTYSRVNRFMSLM